MINIFQSRFGFCKILTNYLVGQKVLKKFYYGDSNYILSDAIIKDLQILKNNTQIDVQIVEKYIDAFIPNKGININQLVYNTQNRKKNTKNLIQKFSFSPHSIVMPQLMKILYNEKDKYLLTHNSGGRIQYLLGSKGISKSTSFILLRYFHNLRIPYIIKNGTQKNSIFESNLKILYFNGNSHKRQIIYEIYQQFLKDFSHQPPIQLEPNVFNSMQELDSWITKVMNKYNDKKVELKLVVDQCNIFYKNLLVYEKDYSYWESIATLFNMPTILVASMNNDYIFQKKDPIIKIAGQDTQQLRKIILDDKIIPKQRIQYGIQCLIFQLRQKNFTVQSIQQILNLMRQFPMTTHLSCSYFIKDYHQIMKTAFLDKQQSKSVNFFKDKLLQLLINEKDASFLYKNIVQLGFRKQNQIQSSEKKQTFKSVSQTIGQIFLLYKLFSIESIEYNYQKNIIQYSTLSNEKNKQKYLFHLKYVLIMFSFIKNINLKVNIFYFFQKLYRNLRKLKEIQGNLNKFTKIKKTQRKTRNIKKKIRHIKHIVYCCLLNKQIKQIKDLLFFNVNLKILRFFRVLFKEMQFQNFMKALIGGSYQAFISKMIKQNQYKPLVVQMWHEKFAYRKTFDFKFMGNVLPLFNNLQKQKIKNYQQQTFQKQLQLKEQADFMLQQGCHWFQTQDSNIGFDFLLTKTDRELLELYFIDASTGQKDRTQKTKKFERQVLKNNDSFQFLLKYLTSQQKIHNIHIFFIVLRPLEIKNSQAYKNILQSSKQLYHSKVKIVQMYQLVFGNHFKFFNQKRVQFDFKPEALKARQQFERQQNKKQYKLFILQKLDNLKIKAEQWVKSFKK